MNVQAPPNLVQGGEFDTASADVPGTGGSPPLAAYLAAGINDWGGVSPVTKDHINPERAWPQIASLRDATAGAGFELRERLCLYPELIARPDFVRLLLRRRIEELVDGTGLVGMDEKRW
jgi:FO synthase